MNITQFIEKTLKTFRQKLDERYRTSIIDCTTEGTTDSYAISPNIFYRWGTITTSLTLTLNTPADLTITNEYMFQFTTGSTAPTLFLPNTITWMGGAPVISANKTYQVSIVNDLAVIGEF